MKNLGIIVLLKESWYCDNIINMSIFKLIFFGILVLIAGTQIVLIFNLYSKNKKQYYLYFLYYLIFIHIFYIINLFSRRLIDIILSTSNTHAASKVSIGLIINFMAWPFMIIAVYMFILFSFHITNRILPKAFKIFYLFISFIEIILFILLLIDAHEKGVNKWSQIDSDFGVVLGNVLIILFILFAIMQFIFFQQKLVDKKIKKSIKELGFIYLFIYGVWFLYLYYFQSKIYINFYLFYLFVFSMNLIPVLFLRFRMNIILKKPVSDNILKFQPIFNKYKITAKESEIVILIREGKSNKEISDILFVSIQTVKNAVSNIFRKVDVRSRTELISFIQSDK